MTNRKRVDVAQQDPLGIRADSEKARQLQEELVEARLRLDRGIQDLENIRELGRSLKVDLDKDLPLWARNVDLGGRPGEEDEK